MPKSIAYCLFCLLLSISHQKQQKSDKAAYHRNLGIIFFIDFLWFLSSDINVNNCDSFINSSYLQFLVFLISIYVSTAETSQSPNEPIKYLLYH